MKFILSNFILFLLLASPLYAQVSGSSYLNGGGSSTGNGGTSLGSVLGDAAVRVELLFTSMCDANEIRKLPSWSRLCLKSDDFFNLVGKVKIGTDYLVYGKMDFKPRDSVNDLLSDGTPFVTYSISKLYRASPDVRRRILVHELSTLMGAEGSDAYAFSSSLLVALEQYDVVTLEKILSALPKPEHESGEFSNQTATVKGGDGKPYAVEILSTEDYTRFCISKGFTTYSIVRISSSPYSKWSHYTKIRNGAVSLNDDGTVNELTKNPSRNMNVIENLVCL